MISSGACCGNRSTKVTRGSMPLAFAASRDRIAVEMPAAAKPLVMPRPMTPEPMTRTSGRLMLCSLRIDENLAGKHQRQQYEADEVGDPARLDQQKGRGDQQHALPPQGRSQQIAE